jgi:hypothetical protein
MEAPSFCEGTDEFLHKYLKKQKRKVIDNTEVASIIRILKNLFTALQTLNVSRLIEKNFECVSLVTLRNYRQIFQIDRICVQLYT